MLDQCVKYPHKALSAAASVTCLSRQHSWAELRAQNTTKQQLWVPWNKANTLGLASICMTFHTQTPPNEDSCGSCGVPSSGAAAFKSLHLVVDVGYCTKDWFQLSTYKTLKTFNKLLQHALTSYSPVFFSDLSQISFRVEPRHFSTV